MDVWLLALVAASAWFVLVVLLCMSKPIARPLAVAAWGGAVFTTEAALGDAGQAAGALTAPKLLPLLILAATASWFLLLPRKGDGPLLTPPLRWAVYYVTWLGFCSLLATDPVSALIRVAQIGLPLGAIIAARRVSPRTTPFVIATVLACAAHVLYAVFIDADYVGFQGEQRLTGLLIANTMGIAGAVALAGAFGLWIGKRGWPGISLAYWAAIGVAGYALIEADARTAVVAVLVAVVAAIAAVRHTDSPRSLRRATVAAAALVGAGFYLAYRPELLGSATAAVSRSNSELGSLTGRLPLWENLAPAILDHFLVGFGPAAYRNQDPALTKYLSGGEAQLSVAHNALIEALVAGGLLGGLLWLVVMVALARHVWRAPPSIRPLALALYAVSAVTAMTTSSAAGIGLGWYVLLALAALPTAGGTPVAAEGQAERVSARH